MTAEPPGSARKRGQEREGSMTGDGKRAIPAVRYGLSGRYLGDGQLGVRAVSNDIVVTIGWQDGNGQRKAVTARVGRTAFLRAALEEMRGSELLALDDYLAEEGTAMQAWKAITEALGW